MFCFLSSAPAAAPTSALILALGSQLASGWALAGVALLALIVAGLAFRRLRARAAGLAHESAELGRRLQAQTAELAEAGAQRQREAAGRELAEAALLRERSFMDLFMRSAPDAVYFKDVESRFVRCSESMAHLVGQQSAADLIGKTDFDFFSQEHARPAFDDEQRIMRTGQPIVGQLERETFADGHLGWSLTSKLPWRDENGRMIGTFGISKVVTEIKNAEEELRQRELLFRLIFEHAPVGVSWRRADLGNTCNFNSVFRRILDLPAAQAADDKILTELTHPEDILRHREMQQTIESGQTDNYSLEKRFVLKDGRLVWGRLSVAVVRNEAGHIIQEIAILEDITERKRTEHELSDTYKHLMDASRAAGVVEVANGVLHNVGNVLNSVNVSVNILTDSLQNSRIGSVGKLSALLHQHAGDLAAFLSADPKGQRILPYLDTLADHLAGEQQRWLVEVASLHQNIDHIKDIVSMQQSYAKVVGVIEVLPPAMLFEDAVCMNLGALTRHDVEVVREFEETAPVQVERHKVLQILINVIRNAKYALDESHRPDKRLLLRIEPGGRGARLIVRDNGIGISAENLARIFSHGFTTRQDGHGFGLHASLRAAKEMGGALTALSDGPGKGATFILELPRAKTAATAPGTPAAAAAAGNT